jgi:gliding motility-associated-like protein
MVSFSQVTFTKIQDDLCRSNGVIRVVNDSFTLPYELTVTYPNLTTVITNVFTDTVIIEDLSGAGASGGLHTFQAVSNTGNDTVTGQVSIFSETVTINYFVNGNSTNGYGVSCFGDCDATVFSTITPFFNGIPTGQQYTTSWYMDSVVPGQEFFTTNASNNTSQANLCVGTYAFLYVSPSGCESVDEYELVGPDTIQASAVTSQVLCSGGNSGAIDLTVIGGVGPTYNPGNQTFPDTLDYTYQWSGPGLFTSTSEDISGLSSGSYDVTITDDNGCVFDASFVVIDTLPIINITLVSNDSISCFGGNDGAIEVSATGGSGDLQFSIDGNPFQNSGSFNNLEADDYVISVRDTNNCIETLNVTVGQFDSISISQIDIQNILCADSLGRVELHAQGGTGVYNFSLVNPQTDSIFENLEADDYTFTIFDSNNCFIDTTVSVTKVDDLSTILIVDPLSCFGLSDGEVNIIVTGGTGPFEFDLDTINQFNDPSFTNLNSGTFDVLISDFNNCTFDTTVIVSQPSQILVDTNQLDSARCFGSSDGAISVTASGGGGGYTYFWLLNNVPFTSFNSAASSSLSAGLYSLVVSDASACQSETFNFEVFEPSPITISIEDLQDLSCDESGDGSIEVSASGGVGTFSYLWDDLTALPIIESLDTGSYTVTVTDQNTCDTTATFFVDQPDTLSLQTIQQTDVDCFGASTGSLNLSASGGSSNYNFSVSPNSATQSVNTNTLTLTDLSAQDYTVQIVDDNNCMFEQLYTIVQNDEIAASFSSVYESCNLNNATITATVSGGTPNYSYSWGGLSDTTLMIDSLPGGFTYNLTVQDDLNCSAQFSHFVGNVINVQLDSVELLDISCNGENDGSLEISVSGGVNPFTYSLLSGGVPIYNLTTSSNVDTIKNISPGVYSLVATDGDGCSNNFPSSITFIEPDLLAIELDSALTTFDLECNGDVNGEIFLNFSGGTPYPGMNYDLFVTNPIFSQQISADTIKGLSEGTYNLTLQDARGCLASISHTINAPLPISVSSSVSDVLCYGDSTGSAKIFVSGGTPNYSVTTNATNAIITQLAADTFQVTNLSEGSYFFEINDAPSCGSVNYSFYVGEPTQLEVLEMGSTLESCLGGDGTASVDVTGGVFPYVYLWSYDADSYQPIMLNGVPNPTRESTNPQNLFEGLYYVYVRDFNECTVLDSVIVNRATNPTLSLVGSTNNLCNGDQQGQITVNASQGNPFYQYSKDGGLSWQFSTVFENLEANSYTVTLRDSLGCTDVIDNIVVGEPDAILIVADGQEVLCIGDSNGSATVIDVQGGTTSISGDYNYQWLNADGINLWPANSSANTSTVNSLSAGYYQLEVEDDNGCIKVYDSVYVGEPTQVEVLLNVISSYNGNEISCFEAQDGIIMANAFGGTGEFTFTWSDGNINLETNTAASFDTLFSLEQGSYFVNVNDENGCSNSNQISISHPSPIDVSFIDHVNIRCEGESDGRTTAIWSGGSGNHNVVWTDEQNNVISLVSQLTGLDVGVYTATVYDNNGCSSSNQDTINYSEQFRITNFTDTIEVSCNGSIDASFDFEAQGGWPPYTHIWNDPLNQISSTAYGLAPGNWYLDVIIDSEGCVVFDSVYVDEPSSPLSIFNVDVDEAVCFGENSGSISLEVSGGSNPYTYSWVGPSFTSTNQDILNLSAGTYSLEVTDSNDCTVFGTYEIEEPLAPIQINSVSTKNVDCNGNNTGKVNQVSVSGGTGASSLFNYNYLGSNPNELVADDYSVIVTDLNGCSDTAYFTIFEPQALEVTFDTINENCAGQGGHIIVHAAGGFGAYDYSISPNYQSSDSDDPDILVEFPIPGEDADTIFTMTLTDQNDCQFVIPNIELHPARIFDYNASYDVCYNDTVNLFAKYNDFYDHSWSVVPEQDVISNSKNISLVLTNDAVVTVTGTDAEGCVFSDDVNLSVQIPFVDLGEDVEIIRGEEVMLTILSGEEPFLWNNSEITRDIYVSPELTTYYSVAALDTSNNCIGSDTLRVFVGMNEGFTPNDDGFNDVWEIDYLNQYDGVHVEVFNRWGSRLWQSDAPNIDNWDGKFNGKDLPIGTYYYIITFPESQNKEPLTGPVTIVR